MTTLGTNQNDAEEMEVLRDARFFQPHLSQDRIPAAFVDLLEHYSGIPRDEQVSHILTVRNQAYKSHPYPCLGRFRFLDLDLATHPLYESYVLPQLKAGTKQSNDSSAETLHGPVFLDLGTCLAQDIRKLIHDGAAVERLYGADLDTSFVDIGYALFRDKDKLGRSQFLTGPGCDVLADPTADQQPGLNQLDGRIDILNATAIFHLFDLENQKKVARRCLRLLRKQDTTPSATSTGDKRKCLILGGQAGNINAGDSVRRDGQRKFRHNEDSWREMWEGIVAEDEWKAKRTQIKVWSQLVEREFFKHDYTTGTAGEPVKEGDRETTWNSKVVGAEEDGHRWHVYSIWVEFGE